jgi:hypothetical protein
MFKVIFMLKYGLISDLDFSKKVTKTTKLLSDRDLLSCAIVQGQSQRRLWLKLQPVVSSHSRVLVV